MDVALTTVNENNWEDVVRLNVADSQKDYVSANVYSLAEAHYRPHCQPRAIYRDNEVVGFLMYAGLEPLAAPTEYEIFRFMVDARYQGQGIGRQALNLAIQEIRDLPGVDSILICYVPSNPVVKNFYASFGFIETELDDHGEMMAVLNFS